MGPEAPLPLSLEEHMDLGRELRQTRTRLHQLCALVVGVYGPQNGAAISFQKAAAALDRLCGDLETQAAADLSQRPEGLYL